MPFEFPSSEIWTMDDSSKTVLNPPGNVADATLVGESVPLDQNESAGLRLGDFVILRELGHGGMGVVYEAQQLSLNRKIALKVLRSGWGSTPQAVQRFCREAEAAARLHHTNIVPVYMSGVHEGTHFYVMELIDGKSLDHLIREMRVSDHAPGSVAIVPPPNKEPRPDHSRSSADVHPGSPARSEVPPLASGVGDFDNVARMIADVGDALDYAHRQGVIHRDIKPSNLLLSPDGRLSISDFGLARMVEQPGMTVSGEFVGTPAYMSPEQISADQTPLDHRSDIYSLGATLYEMLTLQPPFTGTQRDQVLSQILHSEPKAPRKINAKIPVDLETICLKAIEKDPGRRYQSAGEMADDLRRFVNRFAIDARRTSHLTRLKKWISRHPGTAASLACLFAALFTAGFFATQAWQAQVRLRSEKRQIAVENAILEAMSGDSQEALQAVGVAEAEGAEPGRLNLLRGVVEYYRGQPKEAIAYLEKADRQLTASVATKALLARAYSDDGRFERYAEVATALDQLEAKSPEDHLFRAFSLNEAAPFRGLQILESAPARFRQSPIARLGRGMIQTWAALVTGRLEDAELAVEYLRQVDLPDNPLLLSYRVRAEQSVARLCRPDDPRGEQAWRDAARDVERLAHHRDNRMAVAERCWYYFVRHEDDLLLETARQAHQDGVEDTFVTELEANVFYGRKNFDEALRVLQAGAFADDQTTPVVIRGIVLAAIPGRTKEAEKTIIDAVRACRGGAILAYLPAYLQLLGPEYGAKVRAIYKEIRERSIHLIPTYRDRWYHELLDFHCGLIDDETLLRRAGDNHLEQCEAYFYLGLRRLSEGKRSEAQSCFRRTMDTGVFLYEEYIWSRAFLSCIDDPDWLPWVPLRSGEVSQ